ncbi:NUDIX domain-containing protein [Microbacterium karelineae]|uniref:NUDIX domain-containing protein n=1 Tax=Microbacterium karelineae TaxID=2654283 RepID=UPI001E52AC2D|nr:NUDIX hydrolase [Microbacterium karelineae]
MTSTPPPQRGPRNPGDAWVEAPNGAKYWGRFGAAGLLALDATRGVLLQHRVGWSHFGGTWGLPGGALHDDETAIAGALREAQEEAGVPDGSVAPRFTHVFDAGVWHYTTLVADVADPFEPVISDPESLELAWVPVGEVDSFELHPGFGAAWPGIRASLPDRPALLIDAANVVGSVPDGWWKDRVGAATRLRDRLAGLAVEGLTAGAIGRPMDRWFPAVTMVVEGQARAVADGSVHIVRAAGSGDDELVARADAMVRSGVAPIAVTSDRALQGRLEEVGASVRSSGWILDLLGDASAETRRNH